MLDSISATVTLHNGFRLPWLGLGTFKSPDNEVGQAIRAQVLTLEAIR